MLLSYGSQLVVLLLMPSAAAVDEIWLNYFIIITTDFNEMMIMPILKLSMQIELFNAMKTAANTPETAISPTPAPQFYP